MRFLHLVRHAHSRLEPDRPAHTWGLSDEGLDQAAALARHLMTRFPGRFARVVCSEEPKALQTTRALAVALAVPVVILPGVQEQARVTAPFFARQQDFQAALQAFFAYPGARVFGEESADEAHARFSAALSGLMQEKTGDELVVTHGTVLSLLVARANHLDAYRFWREELAMPMLLTLEWPSLRRVGTVIPEGATRSVG
ncbi:histidine phosphatase family protein [Deinococcus peraridilitoris]|uniref:Fructose-2,6-bisphosphatase n=1 Tax=Deinococcus peraridilitoris (strain DSM 19664 / LMG 22246 / CIP 109416 / KR-200) TaxID=937777 RepID=L0A4G7_DEIPD|nr:histidine phosphatase family protein [Deinococcus peraridilitoris]AFZ67920.1 fructose-2,6-bisphosphatase [Deinococcus peraridilitoris DSM 19664]